MTPPNRRVREPRARRRSRRPAGRRRPPMPSVRPPARPALALAPSPRARRSASRSSSGASVARGVGRAPPRHDEPALRRHRGRRRRATTHRPHRGHRRPRAASRSGRTSSRSTSTRARAQHAGRSVDRRGVARPPPAGDDPRAGHRAQGRGARRAGRDVPRDARDGEPFKSSSRATRVDLPLVTGLDRESVGDGPRGHACAPSAAPSTSPPSTTAARSRQRGAARGGPRRGRRRLHPRRRHAARRSSCWAGRPSGASWSRPRASWPSSISAERKADAIMLDNDARPERVVVRMR